MSAYAFLDAPLPLAFAHRGGAEGGVENTMSAFAGAVALGYRYLETDVHATCDGALVAFHDRTLRRVTGVKGRIEDLTWRQVQQVRVGDERVPLLADLLNTWPDVMLNIDVKAQPAVGPLIDEVRRSGAIDRVCIGSFSDNRVRQVREALGPRLCSSLAPREAVRLRLASLRRRKRRDNPAAAACAQLPHRLGPLPVTDSRLVRTAHELGMQVHVWTVNDRGTMEGLLDLGVDGIMTDRPSVLRDVLIRRGSWHD